VSFSCGVGQVRSQPNQELHLATVAGELNRGPYVTEQSSHVRVPVCDASRKTTQFSELAGHASTSPVGGV